MNATEWETLLSVRDALLRAGRGGKRAVIARAAETLRCSVPTVYRRLEEAGLESGRKRRVDAGASAMTPGELGLVGGVLLAARRDNDKQLLSVEDALDIAHASGRIEHKLSAGRVGQLLRAQHLHAGQLAQQTPAVELRSLHPNHVWQLDASVCVLYYMRSGELAAMNRDEFYRNKPQNLGRVMHDLCTRYAVADHYSGAFKFRYFTGGETAQNLVDFFLWAITRQDGTPMHGVPAMAMLDPGAANKGHLFVNLCRRLQCRLQINKPGNARAKGTVEKTHDLIERHFEGRFRFAPPEALTLDGINGMAAEWAAAYGSSRPHSRHGQPRYSVWMRIAPEQLRVPASIEVLHELVATEPEQRRVDNTQCISYSVKGYGALDYDVGDVPGAVVGGKLTVVVNAYRAPSIDVRSVDAATGEECWHTVAPIERNDVGFRADAPVIGEHLRTAAHTPVDEQRNRLTLEAYRKAGEGLPSLQEAAKARKQHAQAYAGVIDAMADVRATPVPAYLPRRGTPLEAPALRQVVPAPLTVVQACKRIKAQLGEAYTPQVYAWVAAKFAGGVPEEQLAAICAQFALTPALSQGERELRAIGGSAA